MKSGQFLQALPFFLYFLQHFFLLIFFFINDGLPLIKFVDLTCLCFGLFHLSNNSWLMFQNNSVLKNALFITVTRLLKLFLLVREPGIVKKRKENVVFEKWLSIVTSRLENFAVPKVMLQ